MSLLKVAGTTATSGQLYVDSVFSTYLYTGTGAAQTITNGIDLAGKGGLVWCKGRTNAFNHSLVDTVRGMTNAGAAVLASEQSSGTIYTLANWMNANSNGFSLGSAATGQDINSSGQSYVSWTFRKAAKFFDVVTYTGTGSARTIAHSLGVAPGMVIVKRTDTTGNWQVYSNGLTSAAYSIQLNLTAAQASAPTVWNSTAPTSSVFSVGTDATVNASGGTYVAYLFAHDTSSTGIIQCGSWTADGGGNATVNLGWEPQWILAKVSAVTGAWYLFNTMSGMSQTNTNFLEANTSNAEANFGSSYIVPNATGFTVKTGFFGGPNVIYMAIRMPIKPPTTGTQVYNGITRTGTGGNATVTGVGFSLDAILSQGRSGPYPNYSPLINRLCGPSQQITTTSNSGEYNYSNALTSITMDGITLGADSLAFDINASGESYGYQCFKRAPGFFDVVCYTGTGSATTQAHNLTVVPELMIVKERSAVNNWWVYDAIDGNTKYSVLNSTATPVTSSTAWNNTTPTASVFSIGTGANVNASAQTFVAYLFATLAGISKVGSYTGNGTGQAIACGFSAGARFVLIKRTDSTGDWYTFDSARGLTSGSSPYLLLNSTAAEVTGNNGVYASTGGFTLGATALLTTNIVGASYIYLSVA